MQGDRACHDADYLYCEKLIEQGSKSFHAASRLLPERVRWPSFALYAFCRMADDTVDQGPVDKRAIDGLLHRLDRIYAGSCADHPVDRAFAHMVETKAMPRHLPEALIEGLAWDVEGRRYHEFSDLLAYAARVASVVGVMMTVIMGERRQAVLARACDLGLAMQLTNIARDIGEDARAGRIYLPESWFAEAGLDIDAWLSAPHFCPQIAALTERLLGRAEHYYKAALPGITYLPRDCRPAIMAAALIYREIGRQLAATGMNSVDRRTVVSKGRKQVLLAQAVLRAVNGWSTQLAGAEPETRFLVNWSPAGEASTQLDRGLDVIIKLQRRTREARARRRGLVHG